MRERGEERYFFANEMLSWKVSGDDFRQDSSEAIGAMGCVNQPLVPAVMKA